MGFYADVLFHSIFTLWWTNIAMENHHFSWENPLFLWPFSIAMLVHQRVSGSCWKISPMNLESHRNRHGSKVSPNRLLCAPHETGTAQASVLRSACFIDVLLLTCIIMFMYININYICIYDYIYIYIIIIIYVYTYTYTYIYITLYNLILMLA